jgi:hypothetical protein
VARLLKKWLIYLETGTIILKSGTIIVVMTGGGNNLTTKLTKPLTKQACSDNLVKIHHFFSKTRYIFFKNPIYFSKTRAHSTALSCITAPPTVPTKKASRTINSGHFFY